MSFSILDLQRAAKASSPPPKIQEPKIEEKIAAEPVVEPAPAPESGEFEFVLGRRQVASLLFVSVVLVMICVAAAYSAGKAMSPKPAAPVVGAAAPEPAPVVVAPQPVPPAPVAPELPIYAEPKIGQVYIQMGAVEKGIAEIFAEGLRKRGLPGIVAPGPTPNIYRVLIGPLPDPASFVKAKDMVDKIGLSTFARKYP